MDRLLCCAVGRCREGKKCHIVLPKDGGVLCLSGTRLQRHHKELTDRRLCDCIVVWQHAGSRIAASIELKSRSLSVSEVIEQLQAGSDLVESECEGVEGYAAILASRGGLRSVDIDNLRRQKVRFRGQDVSVLLARCGDDLVLVMQDYLVL